MHCNYFSTISLANFEIHYSYTALLIIASTGQSGLLISLDLGLRLITKMGFITNTITHPPATNF